MSEERTEQPPPSPDRMIENAKRISQYMREQLEELRDMLRGEPPIEKVEDMLRAAGDRIDPTTEEKQIRDGDLLGELWGLPVIARVPFIPNNNPFAQEADGRDEPVQYESPLEASDLVDDVLDADVVGCMAPQPQDRLDVELHIENCIMCAQNSRRWKLCAHCLEFKVCTDVPTQLRQAHTYAAQDQAEALTYFARLPLCRECKRDADSSRGLVLEE
jgi:hypothetical protein